MLNIQGRHKPPLYEKVTLTPNGMKGKSPKEILRPKGSE